MSEKAPAITSTTTAPPAVRAEPGLLQRKCACGNHTKGGGECDQCRRNGSSLQRSARNAEFGARNFYSESDGDPSRIDLGSRTDRESHGDLGNRSWARRNSNFDPRSPFEAPPIVHEVLRSPGQPLDAATRAFFETRFGQDFSSVRVHTDARAAQSARAVNALAYTTGSEVVFGERQYRPTTSAGQRLLAHELTHVVQQSGNPEPFSPLTVGAPSDSHERAADAISRSVLREPAGSLPELRAGSVAAQVQRQSEPNDSAECKTKVGDEEEEVAVSYNLETDKPEEKKQGTARRRQRQRHGNFVGNLFNRLLGKTQPVYFHRDRSLHQEPKPKSEYENVVIGRKVVSVEKSDTANLRIEHDPQKNFTGNGVYQKGEPKNSTFPYRGLDEGLLFADPDAPTTPKGGRLIGETTTTTVTGTLKFSFGDSEDTAGFDGKGRIRITAVEAAGTTIVFDSGWMTTLRKVQTVVLPNSPGNARYVVEIGVEETSAWHTEYMYDLQLKQETKTVSKFCVDITKKKVKK